MRHTRATDMLEGGADIRSIQQLLEHEKLEITALYSEVTIRQLQEVHARCQPAGRSAETLPMPAPAPQPPNAPMDGVESKPEPSYGQHRADDTRPNP